MTRLGGSRLHLTKMSHGLLKLLKLLILNFSSTKDWSDVCGNVYLKLDCLNLNDKDIFFHRFKEINTEHINFKKRIHYPQEAAKT